MYCHRCGNRLISESLFCNRCGAKVEDRDAPPQPRAARAPTHTPRPARRAPVIPAVADEDPPEEYEEDYPEQDYEDYREVSDGGDQVIFSISPTAFEILPSYLIATTLTLIVTAAVAFANTGFVFAVIAAVVFFIMPISRHIRLKHTVYTLTTTKLEIRSGMLSKDSQSIPLRHIDNVEVSETLKERMIGIGDVLIDSAALDTKMVLNNIRSPRAYADMIMNELRN